MILKKVGQLSAKDLSLRARGKKVEIAPVAAVAVAPQAVAQSQGQNRNFRTPSDSVNLDGTPVAAIVLPGSNQSSVTNNYYTTNNTNNYATSTPSPAPTCTSRRTV